eukprot:3263176-Rhodomonas_salina.1
MKGGRESREQGKARGSTGEKGRASSTLASIVRREHAARKREREREGSCGSRRCEGFWSSRVSAARMTWR